MALPVMATETRVETMGNQHLFIQDDYNIWTWTSTVNNYPRHLIVDHNGISGGESRVGMIVPFMKNAVIGAFFSDANYNLTYAPMPANQRLDLFYGYRAATFDLGIHVDWWGDKTEETGTQSTTAMGVQAGLGFNANGNMFEIDAHYRNLDFTNEDLAAGTAITERDAGSDLGANARYLWAYNNMVTLVPAIEVNQMKISVTNGPESKWTDIDLGLGCNTVPLQGTEFISSLGFMFNKYEVTDAAGTKTTDNAWSTIPYVKTGADIQVKNWLMFRVGATKYIVQTMENKLTNVKNTNSNFMYNIGAGIMLGDVQFDCEVDNDWLNAGPYLLSGENNGDMFTKISFKYDFR